MKILRFINGCFDALWWLLGKALKWMSLFN